MSHKVNRLHRATFAVALAIALVMSSLLASAALAEEPQTITASTHFAAEIVGDPDGGAYDNYTIAYPGNGVEMVISVTPSYSDNTQAPAFGFDIYGPYGYTGKGYGQDNGASFEFTYADADSVTLYMQVYSFAEGSIVYDLSVTGLPVETVAEVTPEETPAEEQATATIDKLTTEEPTVEATVEPTAEATTEPTSEVTTEATVEPTVESTPEPATETVEENVPVTHTLVGSTAGASEDTVIEITGWGQSFTVTMTSNVIDQSYGEAVGFDIFAPSSAETRLAGGYKQSDGVYEATFVADEDGLYTIRVYNYAPGIPLTYSLEVSE